ncbi:MULTISPECIES: hypothetical protein [Streptomyces]|uniref:Gram-positive cocci surface proteins LPxTG domain-containing protein n=1 Tax=Streptomyces lycii TaxID=2654337 RepID=A0ABQ7FE74_9ACTN|nr:hypothetical protein [Streptomyces lycii]KAF4405517.1 hypothetical protein GCU69_29770 [Streptomyces lycii]
MPKPVRPMRGTRSTRAVTLAALGAAASVSVAVIGAPPALAAPVPAQPAAALSPVAAPGAAADAPPGPAAVAEPSAVAPGGTVALEIKGCGTRTGTAASKAFGEIRLQPADLRASRLFGSATVRTYAEPGSHQVRFRCGTDGRVATTPLVVSADGVEAAGNDTFAGLTATTGTAAGGVLLAAAAGAGVYVFRRRARAAGTPAE